MCSNVLSSLSKTKMVNSHCHCHCHSPFGLLASSTAESSIAAAAALIYTRKDTHIKTHYKWININKLLIAQSVQNDTRRTRGRVKKIKENKTETKQFGGEIILDWHKTSTAFEWNWEKSHGEKKTICLLISISFVLF